MRYSRDPPVLKKHGESIRYGMGKVRYGSNKTLRKELGNARSPKEKEQENATDSKTHYGSSKMLRVAFLVRKGPLGRGKKTQMNINKFAGLSWDWVGAKYLFMRCFWSFLNPHGHDYKLKSGILCPLLLS